MVTRRLAWLLSIAWGVRLSRTLHVTRNLPRRGGEPGGTRTNAPHDNVAVAIVSRADVPGTRHTVERLTPPRPRRQGCSVILEPNPNPHASLPSPSASSSSWTRAASPPRTSTPSHQRPTASAA